MADVKDWRKYAYTVAELIVKLKAFPQDYVVILEKDAEGNGYSPLSSVTTAYYEPSSTWSGETKDSKEDFDEGNDDPDYTYDEYIHGCAPAVILGPVN